MKSKSNVTRAEAGFSQIPLLGLIPRFAAFLLLAVLIASSFYIASSASSKQRVVGREGAVSGSAESNSRISELPLSGKATYEPFMLAPPFSLPGIVTFRADCTTPQTDFNLGDVVCAKATGVPVTIFSWHVSWVDPVGFVVQTDTAIADDQATYTYTIPATATSVVNGQTVSNVGTWRVNLTRFSGAIQATARFVVHEPANPSADVFVQKFARDADASVGSGGNIPFIIVVGNQGPDPAANVHLVDSTPSGFSLTSFTQTSGPSCLPALTSDCTIASLSNGARAEFTAVYNSGASSPGAYTTSATVSSDTADPDNSNNTSTAQFVVTSGTGTGSCDLTCPTNITVTANTTEGGQSGAHVTYSAPASTGTCGSISSVPASGNFFPVGTTVVTATSETNGGQCAFTVTVEEATNTNITCPANITVNADANCGATVTLGTPTATGTNVTITGSRSDGVAMYNCDTNGENCVRKAADLPFPAGVTVVTWTAYSHDTAGPYANSDDEIAHRTGNASCQQTVTVNDVTPPTINAPNTSASADANCVAPVPNYATLAVVSDNCACASSDTSQICDSRADITVTQSPAAGTLVGLGPHTITLTANDGSSNPNAGPDGILGTGDDGTGNITTITVTFTVNDTTAPTFTFVPPTVTAFTGPGATSCDTVVNPGTATASDNCGPVTITRSPSGNTFPVGNTTITWTAKDGANNTTTATQTVTVIDNTPPVISCPANITVYLPLNTTATSMAVSYPAATATDNCPGAITFGYSQASGSVFSVGTTTVTATATDASNNSASCSFTVTVLYDFTGFFSPVGNPPVLNSVNAGRAIPVKFSLSGDKGLNIFAANNPYSVSFNCSTSDPGVDVVETVTAGGSSLSFGGNQYVYVWKTESSWAGTCRQLVVTLNDGSVHVANFKFK